MTLSARHARRRWSQVPTVGSALFLVLSVGHLFVASAQVTQPSVTSTHPLDGATDVPRDAFVSADVSVPNGGIDPATVTPETVYLYRTGDAQPVPAVLNTSGGGDVIVLRPVSLLDANMSYTFVVTEGLKDIAGVRFVPFSMSFTTGTAGDGTDSTVVFEKVVLPTVPVLSYTCVTIGPDGKLYASVIDGEILRFTINADGTLGVPESITSLQTVHGGPRFLIGLRFDPASTADTLILWASHTAFAFSNAPDWTGKISRLSGPNLGTVTDYVVNLPRSTRDHVTNQITFGPDGALYILQGSNTAMGAPDSAWDFRPERLLNAALLRLDVAAVTSPPVDVKTEEGGTYDPFAPGAPLRIYATGLRNAYDLLWHTNGHLYVPTNGSSSGGATPGTPSPFLPPYSPRIDEGVSGPYVGPEIPGIPVVNQTMNDYLFRAVEGGYYGHPNPTRHEYVLNGGNPTSAPDPAQVYQYPVGTQPDRNWRGSAFDFGQHYSPNGIIEYRNAAFSGALLGELLVVRYSAGDDIIVLTPGPSGDIIRSRSGIEGLTGFNNPLDLVEDPTTGFIYVAEFGGETLTLLRPSAAGTAYQAEAATVVGAIIASLYPGYAGTGYVDYQAASGDYIEWTVTVSAAGPSGLAFRYANGSTTNRALQLRVNGAVVTSALAFPPTGGWATWRETTATAPLNAGANTIRLTATGSSGPNVDALRLTVPPPDKDLVIEALTLSAGSVAAGSSVTASYRVANRGTVTVTETYTDKLHLSTDATLDAGDVLLGTSHGHTPDLAPNATHAHSQAVTVPAGTAAGSYFLVVQVDSLAAVTETNEGNNVTAVALAVTPALQTGLRSPTANAPNSGGDGNGFESSPQNAHANDTLNAVDNNSGTGSSMSCTSSSKDMHRFYNYGLTFPAGVSIRGIQVRLDAKVDSTSGSPKMCVQLSWNGGSTWTSTKSTPTLGTSMGTFTLGSPTDTWGRSWTTGNFSDANFRVRVINVSSSTSRDFSLDWVAVSVHYQ